MARPIVVAARAKHTATLIMLHGLGDTGDGWAPALEQILASPALAHVKGVCPTASAIPVTLNGGMRMPAWFDLFGLTTSSREDIAGMRRAQALVAGLIAAEPVAPSRVVVGGFSQGGALALLTALSGEKRVGGCIALSTWLPARGELAVAGAAPHAPELPILVCHGDEDPLVPFAAGRETAAWLTRAGAAVQFKGYPGMGHSACDAEMRHIADWLAQTIPATA